MSDTPLAYSAPLKEGETRLCIDPWAKILISANGDVNLCCYNTKVGNLRDGSLDDIINGEKSKQYRIALLSGDPLPLCAICGDKPVCSTDQLRQRVDEWYDDGKYFI
jgi:radical SAM protein with 4Fe4S-binding SPASM domain